MVEDSRIVFYSFCGVLYNQLLGVDENLFWLMVQLAVVV